jgi:hypothetical protein
MDSLQDAKQKNNIVKELVIERLKIMPAGLKISIGSEGTFSKDELIARVVKGDAVGKKIVQIQLKYLQAMKTGALLTDD